MTQKQNNAAAVAEPSGAHAADTMNGHGGANGAAFSIADLAKPFPIASISWRAQSVTDDGTKAMALAYIDARDVMQRLNEVCGANWQNRYSHADKKTVCEIGIKIDGEWVWRANGAGDSDIEAEKGALSDAFKRAAVLWGVGTYLYDMPRPWVPCETYEKGGKKMWKSWKDDPWKFVKLANHPAPEPEPAKVKPAFTNASLRKTFCDNVIKAFSAAIVQEELDELVKLYKPKFDEMDVGSEHDQLGVAELRTRYAAAKTRIAKEMEEIAYRTEAMGEQLTPRQ